MNGGGEGSEPLQAGLRRPEALPPLGSEPAQELPLRQGPGPELVRDSLLRQVLQLAGEPAVQAGVQEPPGPEPGLQELLAEELEPLEPGLELRVLPLWSSGRQGR